MMLNVDNIKLHRPHSLFLRGKSATQSLTRVISLIIIV